MVGEEGVWSGGQRRPKGGALRPEGNTSSPAWLDSSPRKVPPLPYADGRFSIVTCRFAGHHMFDPLAVLKKMRRVCARASGSGRYDARRGARRSVQRRRETVRDPSQVRAIPVEELFALLERAGLRVARTESYRLDNELEDLLSRSFPKPGDADRLRKLYADSLAAIPSESPSAVKGRRSVSASR